MGQRAPAVIDVDAHVDVMESSPIPRPTQPRTASKSRPPCAGFLFPFSGPGKGVSSDYPFSLHDTLPLPWTYSNNTDGTLTLRSTVCDKSSSAGRSSCQACADLRKNQTLAGILDRAKYGVNEKANYAYHSFSGLVEVIQRKNKRIEELRMRGLNAARHIAVQARTLSDHKRFVRAIGSGVVE
ncbi:hypothetical protein B0H13DRAFT_1636065, partial [Mycena leptocephala]